VNRARGAAALLFAVFLLACGSPPVSSPAATSSTGANVTGTLQRGPVATCPAGEPCDPPAVASFLVFSRSGQPDVRVQVGGDGTFSVRLDPGDYSIAAQPPPFHARLEPSTVRVPGSGSVDLRLRIVSSTS